MEVIKGLDVLIKINNTVVGGQKEASLEMSAETIDTTTKTSGGWKQSIAGIRSWTSSCGGIYFLSDNGLEATEDKFMKGETVDLEFSKNGALKFSGKAIITSMSYEAGQDDVVAYTISFDGAGVLTRESSLGKLAE